MICDVIGKEKKYEKKVSENEIEEELKYECIKTLYQYANIRRVQTDL